MKPQPSPSSSPSAANESRRPSSPPRVVDWERVRQEYEARALPVTSICSRYGLSRSRLNDMAIREDWVRRVRRRRNTRRLSPIGRARFIIEIQLDDLAKAPQSADTVQTIGQLLRLLDTVQRLERQHQSELAQQIARRQDRRSDQEMRDTLAQRIAGLIAAEEERVSASR